MKNKFKQTLLGVALIATLALGSAQAQQYGALTPLATNIISGMPALSTNVYSTNGMIWTNAFVPVTKYDEVTLQFTFAGTAASVSNTVWSFADSGDGLYFDTTPTADKIFTIPANGTNVVSLTTNVYIGAAGYFGLYSAANVNSNSVTNVVFTNITTTTTATSTNYTTNVITTPVLQISRKPFRRG